MDFRTILNEPEPFKKVPILHLLNSAPSHELLKVEFPAQGTFLNNQPSRMAAPSDTNNDTAQPHELCRIIKRDRQHENASQNTRKPHRQRPWEYPTPSPSLSPREAYAQLPCTTSSHSSSFPPKFIAPTGSHSNHPYTMEQVDWIRYHHSDLGMNWQKCREAYAVAFPDDVSRASAQCMNSRWYRDNFYLLWHNGDPLLDKAGNQISIEVKVRDTRRVDGLYDKAFPLSLIEKSPERAMNAAYTWITLEDRERLKKVLERIENDPIERKKFLHRQSMIPMTEREMASIVE